MESDVPAVGGRWVEISVQASRDSVDDLVRLFGRHCVGGAVVEEMATDQVPVPGDRVTVKGFLPESDEIVRHKLEVALLLLSRTACISEPQITFLDPEDWASCWKAFFPPQHIGKRTVIVPSWEEYEPSAGDVIIWMDPGMAFGTGLHASTRLCLEAIERLMRPGVSVLDVGTGSGILAISAALQGATRVDAIDVDPVAVDVAAQNAARNGISALVQITRATLGTAPSPEVPIHAIVGYDLLLVNILAEVIVRMAPAMARALRDGGSFVASGIIQDRADLVVEALHRAGLVIGERLQMDDWVAIVGHKG